MSRTPPHLATLTLLNAVSMLSLNMILPSLPSMAADLRAPGTVVTLAVSGYMLVSAVIQIVMGPLSDRLGRRPVMLGAFAIYTAASLGCVLAEDVTLFLVFRFVQAVVVAGTVLSSAVIRDMFERREAASKLGSIAAMMGLAPMLGPMVGGFLDTAVGWRTIFALYTGLGAVALLAVFFDLGETRRRSTAPLRMADYATLLRSVHYWGYVLCAAFSVGTFYVFIAGSPFVSARVFGLSPAMVGLGVGSITGGFIIGAALTSRLAMRMGPGRLILAGRLAALAGLGIGLALFAAGAVHPFFLFGSTISVGFGNGLTIANANAGAISVRPNLAGTAAGLAGALSIGIGAGLTWGTALFLELHTVPIVLLTLMIACVVISLGAAIVALRRDREGA